MAVIMITGTPLSLINEAGFLFVSDGIEQHIIFKFHTIKWILLVYTGG
jgi:hypothetical protein